MDKIFTMIIVISAVFFIYNKVRLWRSPEGLLSRIYQSKSTLSLGFFLIAFSLNLLTFNRSSVDLIIGAIFAILGVANAVFGYRAYKHYNAQWENK